MSKDVSCRPTLLRVLSGKDVAFSQILFLHILTWLCVFFNLLIIITLVMYYIYRSVYVGSSLHTRKEKKKTLDRGVKLSWCVLDFGLLIFWQILHPYASKKLVYSFAFLWYPFWYWYQGSNTDLLNWVWTHSLFLIFGRVWGVLVLILCWIFGRIYQWNSLVLEFSVVNGFRLLIQYLYLLICSDFPCFLI